MKQLYFLILHLFESITKDISLYLFLIKAIPNNREEFKIRTTKHVYLEINNILAKLKL